jgi:hypothetical protein
MSELCLSANAPIDAFNKSIELFVAANSLDSSARTLSIVFVRS